MSWAGRQRAENIYYPNIDYERVLTPDFNNSLNPYSLYYFPNNNWLTYPSLHPAYLATFWQRYFYNLYEDPSLGMLQDPYQNGNSYYYYGSPPNPERNPEGWVGDVGHYRTADHYDNYVASNSSGYREESENSIPKARNNHSSSDNEECFGLPKSCSTPEKSPANSDSPIDGVAEQSFSGPIVTIYGTISVYLREQMRVDLTIDKAIRLVNHSTGTVIAMSSDGRNISLTHQNGKALLENETVHLQCNDISAKISKRGVVFTALKNSLIYLVDASGTKTTTERFRDLNRDISVDLFYNGSTHGSEIINDCFTTLSRLFYRGYEHGDEVYNREIKQMRSRSSKLPTPNVESQP